MRLNASPLKKCEINDYLALLNSFRSEEGLPTSSMTMERVIKETFSRHRRLAIHGIRKDKKLIGFISFRIFYEPSAGVEGIHLCDLFVAPPYRKNGAGKILFNSCIRATMLSKKYFLWWTTNSKNKNAIKFFQKFNPIHLSIISFTLPNNNLIKL